MHSSFDKRHALKSKFFVDHIGLQPHYTETGFKKFAKLTVLLAVDERQLSVSNKANKVFTCCVSEESVGQMYW